MAKKYAKDIQPGERVDTTFLVSRKQLVPFKDQTKGRYLALVLTDRTGSLDARLWNNAELVASGVSVEDLVRVSGNAEDFKGNVQIAVQSLRRVSDAEVDMSDFIPATTKDVAAMEAKLKGYVDSVQDAFLSRLLGLMFSDPEFYRAYVTAPAAKTIHHAFLGGLLEHSLEVVDVCRVTAELYSEIDKDLIVTGAILHDIGKILELSYSRLIRYTDTGRLMGHTVIGASMVDGRVKEIAGFPQELGLKLAHLMLTHHGELAFGSPILPQTIEAMALHQADLLSCRVRQFSQALAQADEEALSAWAPYDRMLDRYVYKGAPQGGRPARVGPGRANYSGSE